MGLAMLRDKAALDQCSDEELVELARDGGENAVGHHARTGNGEILAAAAGHRKTVVEGSPPVARPRPADKRPALVHTGEG